MSVRHLAAALLAAIVPITVAAAQSFPTAVQRAFTEMTAVVPQADAGASQCIHLQWFTPAQPEGSGIRSDEVRIVSRVRGQGALPANRDPQIASDRLVVVSSDEAGRELDWRIVLDPRVIRAELPDDQGRLSMRLLQFTEANLFVDVPDRSEIVRLRVYAPESAAGGYTLRLVATADLR